MFDKIAFVKRVKSIRTSKGLSQAELAGKVGVSATTLSSYENENNPKIPSLDNAANLAKALGVSVNWLCGEDDIVESNHNDSETTAQKPDYYSGLLCVLTADDTHITKSDENEANISIKNPNIAYFVSEYEKLRKLVDNGMLSEDYFILCLNQVLQKTRDNEPRNIVPFVIDEDGKLMIEIMTSSPRPANSVDLFISEETAKKRGDDNGSDNPP